MTDPSYLGLSVSQFLDQLAGPEPAPSGGGAAALAVSMARRAVRHGRAALVAPAHRTGPRT